MQNAGFIFAIIVVLLLVWWYNDKRHGDTVPAENTVSIVSVLS